MATASVQVCDLCGAPLRSRAPSGASKQIAPMMGLVVTFGFSHGGWGRREDRLDFSGEVCRPCYSKAEMLFAPLMDFMRGQSDEAGESQRALPRA